MAVYKWATYLFAAALVIALLQVWWPQYYVTGDGPCHVYNANMLKDVWIGKDAGFYLQYYELNLRPDPNWCSHVILAGLQFLFNGIIAEKILISIYLMLAVSGFYKLAGMNGSNKWGALLIFILLFNHPFSKGFYNFSLSMALYGWLIYAWCRWLDKRSIGTSTLFFLTLAAGYFSHPLPFSIGVISCGLILVFHSIKHKPTIKTLLRNVLMLMLCVLPFALLFYVYAGNHSGESFWQLDVERITPLLNFSNLATHVTQEEIIGSSTAWFLIIAAVAGVWLNKTGRYKYVQYALLFVAGATLVTYLFAPDNMFGGGMLLMRLQLFFFLLLAIIVALSNHQKHLLITGIISFILFLSISIIRFTAINNMSDGVASIVSVGKSIKPYSRVLGLSFNHNGKLNNELIADKNWLFVHTFDYIGITKPLIMLGNYEANTDYFPLHWKDGQNPFHYLQKYGGIEVQPPYADIDNYEHSTDQKIDYILLWCYDTQVNNDPHTVEMLQTINNKYTKVATDPTGRAILYARN